MDKPKLSEVNGLNLQNKKLRDHIKISETALSKKNKKIQTLESELYTAKESYVSCVSERTTLKQELLKLKEAFVATYSTLISDDIWLGCDAEWQDQALELYDKYLDQLTTNKE